MVKLNTGRYAADLPVDDEVVVFLIGMRINRLWQVWKWMPVAKAMPQMLIELQKNPDLGLLCRPRTYLSGRTVQLVQYWRSFEHLESYARAQSRAHLPAWKRFNKKVRDNGSVGIYHETYRVPTANIECVYANMPTFGLAAAFSAAKVGAGRQTAAERLQVRAEDEAPVQPY